MESTLAMTIGGIFTLWLLAAALVCCFAGIAARGSEAQTQRLVAELATRPPAAHRPPQLAAHRPPQLAAHRPPQLAT